MKSLTKKQAELNGYKYATPEDGEGQLIPLTECDKDISYLLVQKEGNPFTIPNDLIKDLIDDYLGNQDEVSDEDGYLNDLAKKVDYSEITKKLNEAFSVRKYFYADDIRLIFSEEESSTSFHQVECISHNYVLINTTILGEGMKKPVHLNHYQCKHCGQYKENL